MCIRVAQAKQTRSQFSNWLCYEASGACAAKPPPLPAGRAPGPAFEIMDRQEAELEKMLAGMKVCGRDAPRPYVGDCCVQGGLPPQAT